MHFTEPRNSNCRYQTVFVSVGMLWDKIYTVYIKKNLTGQLYMQNPQ